MFEFSRTKWILLAGLVLSLCSCQSSKTMPSDPFVFVRAETRQPASVILGQSNTSKIQLLPEIAAGKKNAFIQQVAFLDEQGESGQTQTAPAQKVKINHLTVEPALAERGAEIVAKHKEGREVYCGPWRPNGAAGFWPQIEYLADGGDDGAKVYVEDDWSVHNLGLEDTVVHADTLDGRVIVEPSNRVHLYAPRFGSVRKVEGIINNAQITALSGANNQVALNIDQNREQLGFAAQEAKTGYARTRKQLGGVDGKSSSMGAAGTRNPGAFGGFESVMLYSNLLRQQGIGSAELAYLAEGGVSARAWAGVEGVKVQMNSLAPMAATSEEGAESFFQIDEESKTSKLRLIKVADKKTAKPGDIVEFTLRFDNIGNQPIGNVTVLDNLTTRLEFVPGSAKSSLPSGFAVQPNDGASFVLRFEITDPLLPGQFGVVQFQCRVR